MNRSVAGGRAEVEDFLSRGPHARADDIREEFSEPRPARQTRTDRRAGWCRRAEPDVRGADRSV